MLEKDEEDRIHRKERSYERYSKKLTKLTYKFTYALETDEEDRMIR